MAAAIKFITPLRLPIAYCLIFFRQSKQNNAYKKVDLLYFLHIKEATVNLQDILD